jgi:phospholipase/carboxylesterase
MLAMQELQLAGLKVHVRCPNSTVAAEPTLAVVLLHGFGVPGTDLIAVADELTSPQGTCFIMPEGPLDLSDSRGAGYAGARGWWETNEGSLHLARLTGQVQLAARGAIEGIESARQIVIALLDAIQSEFNLASERIVLGGFSQGALACLDAILHDSRPLAGLIFMSGSMLGADGFQNLARRRAGMHALLSHGKLDPILPYVGAETLRAQLVMAGWDVTWVPFAGSHGIPLEVRKAASNALSRWHV